MFNEESHLKLLNINNFVITNLIKVINLEAYAWANYM
jgi:hypothetical protein